MQDGLNYSDICLVPKKSTVESRDICDCSINFAGKVWNCPVLPSNMKATINFELAEWLESHNYFYILHRFYNYNEILQWVKHNQHRYLSISIGVKDVDKKLLNNIINEKLRIDCLTIDIAHGFSISMEKMVMFINKSYENSDIKKPYIIAGNIFGDEPSISFLENLNVNCAKVGLAKGKACTTFNQTGFASPMFSCGLLSSSFSKISLIGDGGISENGDIIKALVCGYDMIMCGSLFASCLDSPVPTTSNGSKLYCGSASRVSKKQNGNKVNYIEGRSIEILYSDLTYEKKLEEIEESIKSAISYAGGVDLSAFNTIEWKLIK